MFAGGGGGEGGAGAGGLFFRPGRFVFQPKYWANLFKCVFFVLFFCLLFFALPWGSVGRFFFLIFFIRAFSPLPFSRKLLKKFLKGDFLQPLHFKKCFAVPEKQLIFNYRTDCLLKGLCHDSPVHFVRSLSEQLLSNFRYKKQLLMSFWARLSNILINYEKLFEKSRATWGKP